MENLFDLVLHDYAQQPNPVAGRQLAERTLPPVAGSLALSARDYRPDKDLVEAVNVALATGQPLLVTGEPGTGKTQLAYYLAYYFNMNPETEVLRMDVRSTTTHEDLTYCFDAVAYLHAATDKQRGSGPIAKGNFIDKGVIWRAYESKSPRIVLIDEIDKAPRDFPNDLLRVLDEHSFYCRERDEEISKPKNQPPPLVIITSNNERRLPDAFLRRCVFHPIEMTEALLHAAKESHLNNPDFPDLPMDVADTAVKRFLELRGLRLSKSPSLGELLIWLAVLAVKDKSEYQKLADSPLSELPGLSLLIKDADDLKSLG